MDNAQHIVIVGGGFAGTTLARALETRLPEGWRVVLVSEESYTTFNPMLAEVVGASVFPEHVVAPIRQMLRKSRFVMARVTGIDTTRRTVEASTLAGPQAIAYDQLVFAFGMRANLALVRCTSATACCSASHASSSRTIRRCASASAISS
jgi:NADH:ubiquinone reductase (H+-translocating)